jgi:uncharacterized protein YdaU (DUF1376 family)
LNYYEHHLGDYVRDAAHLSLIEEGAYRRLLDAYYIREAPLPALVAECCKLARATSKLERAAVAMVLGEFFHLEPDGHHQRRADGEIAAFQKRLTHNRTVGKLGGRPRKQKPENNRGVLPEKPEANPLQTPVPNLSEAKASGSADAPPPKAEGRDAVTAPAAIDLIFGLGLPLLLAANVKESNARSMLGLMRKLHGDQAVVAAVQRMADEQPVEPVAWLQACLRAPAQKRATAPKSFPELATEHARREVAKWGGGLAAARDPNILDMETLHERIDRD